MKLLHLLLKVDQVHEGPEPSAHVHSKRSLVLLFVKLCIDINFSELFLIIPNDIFI